MIAVNLSGDLEERRSESPDDAVTKSSYKDHRCLYKDHLSHLFKPCILLEAPESAVMGARLTRSRDMKTL